MIKELIAIFKMAPIKISVLWLLDLLESLIIIISPYILGRAVDGVVVNDYLWFEILILIDVVYCILNTANQYFDTRVYSRIVKRRNEEYYKKCIEKDYNESLIDSRLDLVDDFPAFLETTVGEMFLIFCSILVALVYLLIWSSTVVFWISFGSVFLIPVITYNQKLKIVRIGQEKENLNEIRLNCIKSKRTSVFSYYLSNVMKLNIKDSDIDAKTWLITYIVQTSLLVFCIYYDLDNTYSAGSILTTVNYVFELNNYVSDIDPIIIEIKELNRNAKRLK